MEKIAVVGLGIIGASIAASLKNAGFDVAGKDLNEKTVQIALEKGYISRQADDLSNYDAVFIAAPFKATVEILDNETFKDGAFVADICGVKRAVEETVYKKPRNYRYIGLHPMAGKETSGILSASPTLFKGANLIVCVCPQTYSTAVEDARKFANRLGFSRIVTCSAEEHDKKIALTSQLAHIVSNAYVKSGQVDGCDGFTGGSFQDMTRIAGVDEAMWTQLYLNNKDVLLDELQGLIGNLSAYEKALANGDEAALSALLKEGRLCRERIKKKED